MIIIIIIIIIIIDYHYDNILFLFNNFRTFLKDSPVVVRICDDCNQSRSDKKSNNHPYNPEIKIHSVVSADLDYDHISSMKVPLGQMYIIYHIYYIYIQCMILQLALGLLMIVIEMMLIYY